MKSLLVENRNVRTLTHADRGAFLIDAKQYYTTLARALQKAQRSIVMLGWEFNSEFVIKFNEEAPDKGQTLKDFLARLCRDNADLRVYVLVWKANPALAFLRERGTKKVLEAVSPRIHFEYDDNHPALAAMHQKVVVIDDTIAFIGGMDLSVKRWDTTEHDFENGRQTTPSEKEPYIPVHDVQVMLQGQVVDELGNVARERWQRVCNEVVPRTEKRFQEPSLFDHFRWDFHDVPVGISLTKPAYKDQKEVRQVEHLYLDMICAAKEYIYIENQYFSCESVAEGLADSLRREHGPQITIVIWNKFNGIFERLLMVPVRKRLLLKLQQADAHQRLRIYYLKNGSATEIKVHSKVMVVDGQFVRIGSSNLANRSMGMDVECDVTLDCSKSERLQASSIDFMGRLLSEHLQVPLSKVTKALSRQEPMHAIIDTYKGEHCRLKAFPRVDYLTLWDRFWEKVRLIDLAQPVSKSLKEMVRTRRALRYGLPFLFLALVAWLLYQRLQGVRPQDVAMAIEAMSMQSILKASGFAAGSYFALSFYDFLGLKYLRRPMRYAKVGLTAFVSYAVNFNLGALVGGVALRLGLYRGWGYSLSSTSKLILFCGLTTWVGYASLAGVLFAFSPFDTSQLEWLPVQLIRPLGVALIALVALYIFFCYRYPGKSVKFWQWDVELPQPAVCWQQVGLSISQWVLVSLTIYTLLPQASSINFWYVLFVYLLAAVAGLLAHVPAGLGVIETVFLYMLPGVPEPAMIASLLAFRGIYYLIPLCLAGLGIVGLRVWQSKSQHD